MRFLRFLPLTMLLVAGLLAAGCGGGSKAVPANAVAVVLDPDVTSVFGSSDSVNALLRSVIKAMPDHGKRRRKAG